MSRRILFIAYNYPPVGGLGLPGAQRTTKLIRNLTYEQAHVLTVLPDEYPDYVDLNNKTSLPVRNEMIHRTKVFNIFRLIIRLRELVFKRKKATEDEQSPAQQATAVWYERENLSKWQRLKDFVFNFFNFPDDAGPWMLPAFFRGFRMVRKHKITVIFATGMPWSAMCVGWLLSKLTRVPLIVDFRDPWIGNPFHISKGKLLDKTAIKLERKIIRHAKLVFANTEELKAAFIKRYPDLQAKKFITLSNGYDLSDYKEILQDFANPVPASGEKKLVLVHAGFLYGTRDPAPIIDAINRLAKAKNAVEVVFCQIGKIDLDYNFKEQYKNEIAAKKVILIDQLPFDECLKKLASADVLLNIQPKTTSQVPSKLYDYLCLNQPIVTITPPGGALGNLIAQHGFGDLFAPEDVAGITLCLERLAQEKKAQQSKLLANYPQRDLFDIRRIIKQMSTALESAGL